MELLINFSCSVSQFFYSIYNFSEPSICFNTHIFRTKKLLRACVSEHGCANLGISPGFTKNSIFVHNPNQDFHSPKAAY